ncbi:MAG TPA: methylated-DNA--[protein]-cysteine S-methyltransferase [Candidatus Limnocylindrales bacterium]|nr:methylated-DNA--[protein]-cysteine S-methyltransferase [Candidatus Limnocylindrales bacterium]
MNFACTEMASPVGELAIAVANGRLVALCFEGIWDRRVRSLERRFPGARFEAVRDPAGVRSRLTQYFEGDLDALAPIEVECWGTPFQRSVWAELQRIPVGETRTYSEVARAIGQPAAVRAVGTANGANPVAIVVPCHRVIGSNGTLTGFGGGLPNKKWLLDHEGAQLRVFPADPAERKRRAA